MRRNRANIFSPVPLILVAAFLVGCASSGPKIDWTTRLGAYTYDQSVLELGPPDKMATLSDGSRVAEWLTRPGRYYGTTIPYGYYGSPYGPYTYSPFWMAAPQTMTRTPDTYLRLIFGPDGVLMDWTDVRK